MGKDIGDEMGPGIVRAYGVRSIPDPSSSQLRDTACGNVYVGVFEGAALLLRALPSIEPDQASLSLVFLFRPEADPAAKQSRLTLYVVAWARDEKHAELLSLLIERGPLARFYGLERVPPPNLPGKRFVAACDILRREDAVAPLLLSEHNAKIPSAYYAINPFVPEPENDFLVLDSLLDKTTEHVMVSICIEPIDLSAEQAGVTRYCARLQEINRTWSDDADASPNVDFFVKDDHWRPNQDNRVVLPKRRDPLADDVHRTMQKIHQSLRQQHLLFHFRTFAESEGMARLAAAVLAKSAFRNDCYTLRPVVKGCPDFETLLRQTTTFRVERTPTVADRLGAREPHLYGCLGKLAHVATADELSGAFRLPMGSHKSPYCIRQNTDPPLYDKDEMVVLGWDADETYDVSTPSVAGLPRGPLWRDLKKHIAIFGMPGGGKSTALLDILLQLYKRRVPVIFFAPIAGEEAAIKRLINHPDPNVRGLAKELRILTPGRSDVSPLLHSPLARDIHIMLDQHIEGLMECFKGSVPFFPALEGILREALYLLYEEMPLIKAPPVMADLVRVMEQVLRTKGYDGEISGNVRAAIEVRFRGLCQGSVGKMFECGANLPSMKELTQGYYIIRLDALPEEEVAKLVLFCLKALREFITSTPQDGVDPRLVILIDEAHLLLGRDTSAAPSEFMANPKAYASKCFCRMLAEFRKRRVGLVIADQSPSGVSEDVLRMTATKLTFRTVAKSDREALGGAMRFDDYELDEVACLRTGEVLFITEAYYRPRKLLTTNLHQTMDLSRLLSNAELQACVSKEPWFKKAQLEYEEAKLSRLRTEMDRLDRERGAMAQKIAELCARAFRASVAGRGSIPVPSNVRAEAHALEASLGGLLSDFRRTVYGRFMNGSGPSGPKKLRAWREDLRHRFESVIVPDTELCLRVLARLAESDETQNI